MNWFSSERLGLKYILRWEIRKFFGNKENIPHDLFFGSKRGDDVESAKDLKNTGIFGDFAEIGFEDKANEIFRIKGEFFEFFQKIFIVELIFKLL